MRRAHGEAEHCESLFTMYLRGRFSFLLPVYIRSRGVCFAQCVLALGAIVKRDNGFHLSDGHIILESQRTGFHW